MLPACAVLCSPRPAPCVLTSPLRLLPAAYILILYMFSQPTPPMLEGKGTATVLVNGSLSSKAILKAGLPGHQQEEQEVADEVLEDDFPEPPQYTVTGILQGGLSGRVSRSPCTKDRLGA